MSAEQREAPIVLMASSSVATRAGSDLYARDLALGLLRNGWRPVVYASRIGPVAEEIRRATIPVISDLGAATMTPDIIHGNHGFELLAAMFRWPDVPAVFVCHGGLSWDAIPPRLARVRKVVAVDENCRDRVVLEYGVPSDQVSILMNSVDLVRFARRGTLPEKPRRALVFSNNAHEATFVAPIRAACAERGISVDVAGVHAAPAERPETLLQQYDLVFGKARCALEALAVGCAAVVCDERGLASYVDSSSVAPLRRLNFGARSLQRPVTAELVGAEIDRYDAADAARVTDIIRDTAGSDLLARQFADLYDGVIADRATFDRDEELRAASQYMQKIAGIIFRDGDLTAPPQSIRLLRRLARSRRLAPLLHRVYRALGAPA